jgi:hypothetical protein
VSHAPQRQEKNCLNCGTTVQGRYCQNCGQENAEPHETFWHMVTHFFYDITHFDGSFFTTIKDLLFKPGFLTKEYIKGRRKAYLHPVRMYVFTSAVFFLVFFSLFSVKESDVDVVTEKPEVKEAAFNLKEEALKKVKTKKDSVAILNASELIGLKDSLNKNKADSSGKTTGQRGSGGFKMSFGGAEKYRSVKEYDSIQNALPKEKKDGWFMTLLYRKVIGINERYKGKEKSLMADIINKFLHSFPYLLFVSLPLYALFLKLLYIRRKQFYFADHGVFLIHLYVFTFIFMLLYFGLDKLKDKTSWSSIGTVQTILILTGLFYTLKAMRNFYGQGWGKTISKFILFNFLCLVTAAFLFGIFFLFSFYQL